MGGAIARRMGRLSARGSLAASRIRTECTRAEMLASETSLFFLSNEFYGCVAGKVPSSASVDQCEKSGHWECLAELLVTPWCQGSFDCDFASAQSSIGTTRGLGGTR